MYRKLSKWKKGKSILAFPLAYVQIKRNTFSLSLSITDYSKRFYIVEYALYLEEYNYISNSDRVCWSHIVYYTLRVN